MSKKLAGKVVIITGTGGSIGREAALLFAREGALIVGAGLGVADALATVDAVRAEGGTMVSMQPCDLSKAADCQALVDLAVQTFGRVDVLFNNAAMAYFNWIEDISDEEWDRNRREEVDLVFYLTRAAWPHLKASHGVIVNTASLTALMSFENLGSLAHTTAKAGIIGMTRQLAMEGRHPRHPRELHLAGGHRDQPDARAIEGPRVGRLHARHDLAGSPWPSPGDRAGRPVPGLRRQLLRHGHGHRRGRRHARLVTPALAVRLRKRSARGRVSEPHPAGPPSRALTHAVDDSCVWPLGRG